MATTYHPLLWLTSEDAAAPTGDVVGGVFFSTVISVGLLGGRDMIPIDEVVHFDIITRDPETVAAMDATGTPTFSVFEEATDTPILSAQNFTKRTSLDGHYRGTFTASTANGFEAGKWYSVVASATVNGYADKAVVFGFRVAPAETTAGVPKVDVSALTAGIIVAASIADGALTNAKFGANAIAAANVAADVGTEIAAAVLAAATAAPIDANVQKVNDITIAGNGTTVPMGAA
jgi:hypothetical protein